MAADTAPHSVEAEQQVLGALMLDNSLLLKVGGLAVSDFYDPIHALIFSAIKELSGRDALASPVTLTAFLGNEPGFKELGGGAYLARLVGASISASQVADYAGFVVEQREKRDLVALIRDAETDLMTKTPGDVAAKIECALSAMDAVTSSVRPVSMMAAVTKAVGQIVEAQEGREGLSVRPGIPALASIASGFYPGELWLLAGRPSMGKSAVALSLGLEAARHGHPVILASLEMTSEALALRALSEQSSINKQAIPYQSMRGGDLTPQKMQALARAAEDISGLPFYFLPREYQDTSLLPVGVKQSLRRVETEKLPLVIVDYAQLMRAKGHNRFEQITEVSLTLKGLAMSLGLPVIALSQLSRAVEQRENKRPMLSDLRESGQLEQDADGVMFCYRDEYYLEREQPDADNLEKYEAWEAAMRAQKNKLEIIVAKQRMGQIGTAHVMFAPAMNRVWER